MKIDARSKVPYKFVIRALNACVGAGLSDITFAQPEVPY